LCNIGTIKVSRNHTLPISMYYSTCYVTHCLVILLLATLMFPWNFRTQVMSIYCSLLQFTSPRKRPLLPPTNPRRGPTENMSRGLYLLLCDVTVYAEVCLPSRCLETGCIITLFYGCVRVVQGVYRAVAWQCVDISQYYNGVKQYK
jgi:hypothetical protein